MNKLYFLACIIDLNNLMFNIGTIVWLIIIEYEMKLIRKIIFGDEIVNFLKMDSKNNAKFIVRLTL